MGLIRKVITSGQSKIITLPAEWIESVQKQSGAALEEVEIEVTDTLKISPIIQSKEKQ